MGDGAARLVARFDGWTLRRTPLELFRGDQPSSSRSSRCRFSRRCCSSRASSSRARRSPRTCGPTAWSTSKPASTPPCESFAPRSPTMPSRRSTWRPCHGRAIASSARSNRAMPCPQWRCGARRCHHGCPRSEWRRPAPPDVRRPGDVRWSLASVSWPLLRSPSSSSQPARPPSVSRRARHPGHQSLGSRCCRSRT